VEAGAADLGTLDERDVEAELRGPQGGRVAAGATTDDDDVDVMAVGTLTAVIAGRGCRCGGRGCWCGCWCGGRRRGCWRGCGCGCCGCGCGCGCGGGGVVVGGDDGDDLADLDGVVDVRAELADGAGDG